MENKAKVTPEEILKKAKSFLGVKESPPNSNNVVFNKDYYGKAVRGAAYPWCCAFVWDIFRMCGASKLFCDGKKVAYCPTVESWGKGKKLDVAKDKGRPGDLILFDFTHKGKACHIGIIESRKSDGSYVTIEGNTGSGNDSNGGEVMRRTRSESLVRCIIRPQYNN